MKYTYNCAKCGKPATHTKSEGSLGTWSCKPCGGKVPVKREKA